MYPAAMAAIDGVIEKNLDRVFQAAGSCFRSLLDPIESQTYFVKRFLRLCKTESDLVVPHFRRMIKSRARDGGNAGKMN